MPAAKTDEIIKKLYRELLAGKLGTVGTRFMTVRELAAAEQVSLKTAFGIMGRLKEDGIIEKDGRSFILARQTPPMGNARGNMLIGFVATCLESPFFAKLACCAEEFAYSVGASLIISSSNYDFATEKKRLGMFLRQGVSGIMICPWASGPKEEAFYRTLNVPYVMLGRKPETIVCDAVLVNNQKAGLEMARHLCSQGIRRFAYIGQAGKRQDSRLLGFRSGLMENNIPADALECVHLDVNDPENCRSAIMQFLKRKGAERTGIFCYHDLFAVRVIHCCTELGIRIPEEIAVAGFDDLPVAREIFPPLTTISYPVREMARIAFETLYAKIRFHALPSDGIARYLDSRLVIRKSTVISHKKPLRTEANKKD